MSGERDLLREFRRGLLCVELAGGSVAAAAAVGWPCTRGYGSGSVSFFAAPVGTGLRCGVVWLDVAGDVVWSHSETVEVAR